jgi:outer membrane receptor for ferrienterochelin and colicins
MYKSRHIVLSIIICHLSFSAALAQVHQMIRPDTVYTQRDLNPVVVTGSGHHQRLKQTSTPVRVLTQQEIRELGISTFDGALTHMLPQVSMAPSSMGSGLRMNGLGGKYILVLVNGQKLSGDIANNLELGRINMSRVKRIEVLDGAASSLYGSDAIAGVINIITAQPTDNGGFPASITSDTRVSGEGQLTESVALDVSAGSFGSYTTFVHDQADSYRINDLEYVKGSDTETQPSIAPLFTGYQSNSVGQKFTFAPTTQLAMNAGMDYFYKMTDRPETAAGGSPTGGIDYEMRYKGLRWNVGTIYKFDARNSVQVDYTIDRFRYGKEYDVATNDFPVGTYVQSKKQRSIERQVKAILGLLPKGTTIVGNDWRTDKLIATSGNIDQEAYIMGFFAQHEQRIGVGQGFVSATLGARYDYHQTFGNHFTPKASLMYSTGPLNLRATYSAGFRAPGLDELYYHYFSVNRGKAQVSFGNQQLKPEKSHYLSLNAEYRTNDIALSVTGFVNRINDMVVKQNVALDDNGRQMLMKEFPELTQEQASKMVSYANYQNSDKGDVKGVQVNASVNIMHGLNITANYAYTYARSKSIPSDGGEAQWELLERSVRHTATVSANYHRTWGRYGLNVNLNGRLQSKTYYTGTYENAPGFGVWNLHTTHSFDCLRWAFVEPGIGVDNIFDRVDRRIDSATRKYALYSPGRMLVVSLKLRLKD